MTLRFLDKVPEGNQIRVGDVWDAVWMHGSGLKCPYWNNCDGRHLVVVLPNRETHDVNGRASNCTMPDDKTHRCWIVHGDVENMTVDKNGETCQAGAGSIVRGGWHGFIRNGEFVEA